MMPINGKIQMVQNKVEVSYRIVSWWRLEDESFWKLLLTQNAGHKNNDLDVMNHLQGNTCIYVNGTLSVPGKF